MRTRGEGEKRAMKLTAEDRLDIMELCARYSWCADMGDHDGFAATFAEDGELCAAGRTVKGRDDIAALHAATWPRQHPTLRHWTTSHRITMENGLVVHRSYFTTVVTNTPLAVSIDAIGSYVDHLARTSDGWKFSRREIVFLPKGGDAALPEG